MRKDFCEFLLILGGPNIYDGLVLIITSDPDPLLSILVKDHLEQRAILHLSEDQLATVVRASDYNCPSILLQNTTRDGRTTALKAVVNGWMGRMEECDKWMDHTFRLL